MEPRLAIALFLAFGIGVSLLGMGAGTAPGSRLHPARLRRAFGGFVLLVAAFVIAKHRPAFAALAGQSGA
jgi:hypothetical protein